MIRIDHPDLPFEEFEYTLGENNDNFQAEWASLRSVSFKNALLELSGRTDETTVPDLKCHFSGELKDDSKLPWIKFKMEREYYVKSIKIFNIKNGIDKSGLEGARFYVGDNFCA
jgi:hypothetical protein